MPDAKTELRNYALAIAQAAAAAAKHNQIFGDQFSLDAVVDSVPLPKLKVLPETLWYDLLHFGDESAEYADKLSVAVSNRFGVYLGDDEGETAYWQRALALLTGEPFEPQKVNPYDWEGNIKADIPAAPSPPAAYLQYDDYHLISRGVESHHGASSPLSEPAQE